MRTRLVLKAALGLTAAAAASTGWATAAPAHEHPPSARGHTVSRSACSARCQRELAIVRRVTRRYRTPTVARRDGFLPSPCVQSSDGAMGEHWTRWDRMYDQHVNIREPEQLLYLPTARGPRLVAVEWSAPALVRGTFHWGDPSPRGRISSPPRLFGRPFDGPMAGHSPQQPWHFDLHVWLWRTNPSGIFGRYNPAIACPENAPASMPAGHTGMPATASGPPPGAAFHGVLTTTVPGGASGYRADIRTGTVPGAAAAGAPLRSMRFTLAPGFRIDTSVPARCMASDQELRRRGASACPRGSRVGTGGAVVAALPPQPAARTAVDMTLFNTRGGQIVLITAAGARTVMGVARVSIRGRTFTVRPPTCVAGGQPPQCQDDEIALLEYHERLFRLVRGGRSYRTAPAHCPPSGHWTNRVTLTYADGTRRRLRTASPCRPSSARGTGPRRDGR